MGRLPLRRPGVLLAVAALVFTGFGAPPAQAAETYVVNRAIDDSDGSCDPLSPDEPGDDCTLREAITLANDDAEFDQDTITFDLPTGQTTIEADSELPQILEPITINGLTQPGATADLPLVQIDGQYAGTTATGLWLSGGSSNSVLQGLVINRFGYQQVLVDTENAVVRDSFLGVDSDGETALESPAFGTLRLRVGANGALLDNNVVGSLSSAPAISLENVSQVEVTNSYVGVSRGFVPLGSGTSSPGIRLGSGSGNVFAANNIDANGALGIDLGGDGVTPNDVGDLDTGPNGRQNFPVIDTASGSGAATTVSGSLNSTPSTSFDLDFFTSPACDGSGHGEGREHLTSTTVTTGAGGNATFEVNVGAVSVEDQITATATGPGGTSEFSACEQVLPPAPLAPQAVTAAAGDGEAVVEWLPADTNGGADIASYEISSTPDTASTPVTVQAPQTEVAIPELVNGTEYTFTVTATNVFDQESPPSAPSDPVTPGSGAPDPETAADDLPPGGGTVTTGSDATPTDPTNTTVTSPTGGVVTLAEGVTEQPAPDLGPYYGQQVDITAPDATATDPLELAFVVDCSVLPAEVSTCADPLRARARSAPRATVSVRDGSYSPRQARVDLGGKVTWRFTGKRRHSVTESTGLAARGRPLFDSRPRARGARFTRRFTAAGTYAYGSTVRGDPARMRGAVGVPVEVDGETVFWARSLPAGTAADVQYRHRATAGDPWSAWTTWRDDTTSIGEELTAGLAGAGDYRVRARVQSTRTDRASGWSPAAVATLDGPSRLDAIDLWHQTDLGVPATNAVVPDCTGPEGTASPAPTCVWSEEVLPDGDLRVRVFSTRNGRWRVG